MFCHFIFLSLLSCVITNEMMFYIGEIVDDSKPIKTKKGQLCYGTVILPHVIVTTCSCAVQFGGKITEKNATKLSGRTKFKLPSRLVQSWTSYNIIAVGIHLLCKDAGNIWAFDIAIAKLKHEVLELFKEDFSYNTGKECEVYRMPSLAISHVAIVTTHLGNCSFPPQDGSYGSMLIYSTYLCITGANCKYDVGTPIVCKNDIQGIMISQDCVQNQSSTAITFDMLNDVPGWQLITHDDYISKTRTISGANNVTIYLYLLLLISSLFIRMYLNKGIS